MAWSEWCKLDEANINNVPNQSGIYRLKLPKSQCFQLLSDKKYWLLKSRPTEFLAKGNSTYLVYDYEGDTYSMLAYIGKAEDLQVRLKQHWNESKTNDCVKGLKKRLKELGTALYFSYKQTEDIDNAENAFYAKFIEQTGDYCPPADNNSNECKNNNGCNLPIKYKRKITKGQNKGSFKTETICSA